MKVAMRYVGTKPTYKDHLFGTGIDWEFGQVEDVPVAAAIRMLSFAVFEDARDDKSVPLKVLLLAEPDEDDEQTEDELAQEPPLVNLENMTKAQLSQFAQSQFGVLLEPSLKKDEMIDTVRRQMGKRVA